MKAYQGCDIGRVRTENQDSVSVLTLADGVLALVCDGMGGMQNGSAASHIAIQTAGERFSADYRAGTEPEAVCELLRLCAAAANAAVYREAVHGDIPSRMGTTMVGAFVRGDTACIVNVGDSRCYLIPAEGEVRQLTTDHTVVQLLYEQGVITAEERATHIRRNELMRAVGVSNRVLPDTRTVKLAPGDKLVLCSDGLYGMVGEAQLGAIVHETAPQDVPARCIAAANENGGRDNISVVIIDPAETD